MAEKARQLKKFTNNFNSSHADFIFFGNELQRLNEVITLENFNIEFMEVTKPMVLMNLMTDECVFLLYRDFLAQMFVKIGLDLDHERPYLIISFSII